MDLAAKKYVLPVQQTFKQHTQEQDGLTDNEK